MTSTKQLVAEINRKLGAGTVRLGNDPSLAVTRIPTGVLPMDVLLDGGLPRNRYTEVYGDFSTLKSYIGLRAVASVQQQGGTAALVDTEHSFDPAWASSLGVRVDDLIIEHPATGEHAVDVTEVFVRAGVDLVVWDSVAASLPQTEQEKMQTDKVQPARLAEMMSRAMRKLTAANSTTAVLLINQTRTNIGMTFGPAESVPGGRAVPFYASYRIRLTKAGKIQQEAKRWDGEKMTTTRDVTAFKIRAHVEKSKLSAPHSEAIFTFDLSEGEVDELGYIISEGLARGLVTKQGAMWAIPGTKIKARGEKGIRTALTEDLKLQAALRDCLISHGALQLPKRRVVVKKQAS